MRVHPTAKDLLTLARKVLREDLVGHLPAEQKYEALMAANAIAISLRQLEFGNAAEAAELAALASLFGETAADADDPEGVRAALDRLYQRLCVDIRSGQFDPGRDGRNRVLGHLRAITEQRLRESNPKALAPA